MRMRNRQWNTVRRKNRKRSTLKLLVRKGQNERERGEKEIEGKIISRQRQESLRLGKWRGEERGRKDTRERHVVKRGQQCGRLLGCSSRRAASGHAHCKPTSGSCRVSVASAFGAMCRCVRKSRLAAKANCENN